MAKYDLESLLAQIKTVCTDGLNTRLTAITTEKGDSVELPSIASAAYFYQVLDKSLVGAHKAFIFYGSDDPVAQAEGPHTLEDYQIFVIAVLREYADGEAMSVRMMRYARALKEIFEEAYTSRKISTKILVSSITPTNLAIQDVEGSFRACGVKIRAVIG